MRPEIVDSFVEEYNLHGPKLTLDSVSARIHISKKTIYRFFRSKDDIYSFILADMKEEFAAKREAVLANHQLSCGEKIEVIVNCSEKPVNIGNDGTVLLSQKLEKSPFARLGFSCCFRRSGRYR